NPLIPLSVIFRKRHVKHHFQRISHLEDWDFWFSNKEIFSNSVVYNRSASVYFANPSGLSSNAQAMAESRVKLTKKWLSSDLLFSQKQRNNLKMQIDIGERIQGKKKFINLFRLPVSSRLWIKALYYQFVPVPKSLRHIIR